MVLILLRSPDQEKVEEFYKLTFKTLLIRTNSKSLSQPLLSNDRNTTLRKSKTRNQLLRHKLKLCQVEVKLLV